MEELTSDIPNVSEEATKDLDENGIVLSLIHIWRLDRTTTSVVSIVYVTNLEACTLA